ncbi:MAG TPA: hypothetical protein VK364_00195 [Hymenobacter sp.]|nr:hypothetical protein [Hymenobacter sp.]
MKYRLTILCGVVLFTLTACTTADAGQNSTLDRATIEQYARIKLPASATDIHSYTESGMDRIIYVRFTLPAGDLEQFLRDARYTEPLRNNYNPIFTDAQEQFDWWQTDQAQSFRGIKASEPSFAKNILVDTSDPQTYIVYLEHFEL